MRAPGPWAGPQGPESVACSLGSFWALRPDARCTEPGHSCVPRPCWQLTGGAGNGVGDMGMWGQGAWNRQTGGEGVEWGTGQGVSSVPGPRFRVRRVLH